MADYAFHIVDVFAETPYAGNPLAVVPGAAGLASEDMQRIAREFNFSETAFITAEPSAQGHYPVRIFTPAEEVPFAGHPTLGTAWVLRNLLRGDRARRITLDLRVGSVDVAFERDTDLAVMTTPSPRFQNTLAPAWVAELLGLGPADLDPALPCQVVSTGLPALIVPLVDLDAVQRIRVAAERLRCRAATTDIGKVLLVFCRETVDPGAAFHVRVFGPLVDVPEDPATGSANSCLAAYLVEHRALEADSIDLWVEQGLEIGRPSRLSLRAWRSREALHVQVGGHVHRVARGQLTVDTASERTAV